MNEGHVCILPHSFHTSHAVISEFFDICYSEKMKEKRISTKIDSFAERTTTWIGSPFSLVIHTFVFIGMLSLPAFGIPLETVLLLLTTAVSLEAIYLALFIQMSINRNTAQLVSVEEDLEDIQEDVDELSEDIEEIQEEVGEIGEDVEEIQKDVEEISEDIEEMSEDVEGIEKNVKEISEDVEEIQEDVAELEESTDSEIARDQRIDSEQQSRIAKIELLLSELKNELLSIRK